MHVPLTTPLAAIILLAGVVQLFAVTRLGRWSEAVLTQAALEGPGLYIAIVIAVMLAVAIHRRLWFHPRRTREIAAALTAVLIAISAYLLASRLSLSGLIYHGEYILHHFLTICSAVVAWSIARHWRAHKALGVQRWLAVVVSMLGIAITLGAHLATLPSVTLGLPEWLTDIGVGALIFAPVLAVLTLPGLGSWPRRLAALLVLSPILVRVGLSGLDGLHGALVPGVNVPYLLVSLGVCACAVWGLPGDPPPRNTRIYLWTLATAATFFLYSMYTQKYGFVEADLGTLGHSLFGFDLAYPGYVPTWVMAVCGLGLTALLAAQWEALFRSERRNQGLALGILAIAGLGLSSPQVALMSGLGGLLLVHSFSSIRASARPAQRAPTEQPLPTILAEVSDMLGLPSVVSLTQPTYTLLALRGELSGTALRMQARTPDESTYDVELEVGVIGRGEPRCELRPGRRGRIHAIDGLTETHRVFGNARELERLPPTLFDHIAAFPDAAFSLWPGGFRIVFGNDLSALSSKRAVAMIRLLVSLHGA